MSLPNQPSQAVPVLHMDGPAPNKLPDWITDTNAPWSEARMRRKSASRAKTKSPGPPIARRPLLAFMSDAPPHPDADVSTMVQEVVHVREGNAADVQIGEEKEDAGMLSGECCHQQSHSYHHHID